ncbi:MAG TPA: antitermination protein NusB [Mycobacterium sp.]|nr:antitermination protein NusB [Mycobacterium sp.]HUH68165.1 antitermination protein NusB [Mycobacterium sp.]
MTRLELRAVVAAVLAATVVLGAVVCAAYRLAIVASALSIYALGVGAWLYHSIERLIMARRISTVRSAAKPLQPLLPVMAALMGLTQAVVRSLSDVTDLPSRRWELPVLRWMDNSFGNRSNQQVLNSDDSEDELGG